MNDLGQLRYPISRFTLDPAPNDAERQRWTEEIRSLPVQLGAALEGIDEAGLEATYRDGAWTVRQLVHHLADAHGISFFRFRHAMAEDSPAIAAWDENAWARRPEVNSAPIEPSILMIEGTHARWAHLLDAMRSEDFARIYRHPENGDVTLDWLHQYMAWHGRHHVAQIRLARRVPVHHGEDEVSG